MSNDTENKKELTERAARIMEILNEEPKIQLQAFLRFSEMGVTPDVRLVIVKEDEKDNESNEGNTGESEGASEPSEGESVSQ